MKPDLFIFQFYGMYFWRHSSVLFNELQVLKIFSCYLLNVFWLYVLHLRKGFRWLSGKESACQCRGHGFYPWFGKTPHAMGQLSPCAATAQPAPQRPGNCDSSAPVPQLLKPTCPRNHALQQGRPLHREAGTPQLGSNPPCHNQRKACTTVKTQHSQK